MTNEEEFNKIAEDFNLEKIGFSCTLPGVYSADFIMKFNYRNQKIYCAKQIMRLETVHGSYIGFYGQEELEPKLARARVAVLVKKYKEIQLQKKLEKIKKDFE